MSTSFFHRCSAGYYNRSSISPPVPAHCYDLTMQKLATDQPDPFDFIMDTCMLCGTLKRVVW